jgi:DNA-binding transcriptional LysR family regulator
MSDKPNIEHIFTFIKVVESGSFTAAADLLGLSKSVVSKHVSALEDVLQAQLIKRTTRKLNVTDIGREYYDQVKSIPYAVEHAQQAIQPHKDEPRGKLKVISPLNFISSLKLDVVPQYLLQHPHVELELLGVRPVIDYLDEQFDVIILWKLQHDTFLNYNLQSVKLFSMPIGVYASPDYLAKHGAPKTPADLKSHNCFSSLGNSWPFKQAGGDVFSVDVGGRLNTNSDEVVDAVCSQNGGIAYSYPFVFYKSLKRGHVLPILSDYTHVFIELYAFYHPTSFLPRKIAVFIEEMQTYYQARQNEILERGNF